MDALLFRLLTASVAADPVPDLAAWWPRQSRAAAGLTQPIERAVAGGFAADRLGYAFAAGYREALRQLVPELNETPAALCATEASGVHPRLITTQLSPVQDGFRLNGDKTWVTLGTHAAVLLVIASEGKDSQGRNRLCLCQVPATRAGVTLSEQPPTPFAPEIPHASLRLRDVAIGPQDRLPGDGYERYLKPFRTIEDLHVHAALLGWLLQLGRGAGWPRTFLVELVALISTVRALAAAPPDDPTLHVALGGLLLSCQQLVQRLEPWWPTLPGSTRVRWERDRMLLEVAGKARAQRLDVAWERLQTAKAPTP